MLISCTHLLRERPERIYFNLLSAVIERSVVRCAVFGVKFDTIGAYGRNMDQAKPK